MKKKKNVHEKCQEINIPSACVSISRFALHLPSPQVVLHVHTHKTHARARARAHTDTRTHTRTHVRDTLRTHRAFQFVYFITDHYPSKTVGKSASQLFSKNRTARSFSFGFRFRRFVFARLHRSAEHSFLSSQSLSIAIRFPG